jgi:hypothetical protein
MEYRLVDDRFTATPSLYYPGGSTKVRRGDVRLETMRERRCHCVTVDPQEDGKRASQGEEGRKGQVRGKKESVAR